MAILNNRAFLQEASRTEVVCFSLPSISFPVRNRNSLEERNKTGSGGMIYSVDLELVLIHLSLNLLKRKSRVLYFMVKFHELL